MKVLELLSLPEIVSPSSEKGSQVVSNLGKGMKNDSFLECLEWELVAPCADDYPHSSLLILLLRLSFLLLLIPSLSKKNKKERSARRRMFNYCMISNHYRCTFSHTKSMKRKRLHNASNNRTQQPCFSSSCEDEKESWFTCNLNAARAIFTRTPWLVFYLLELTCSRSPGRTGFREEERVKQKVRLLCRLTSHQGNERKESSAASQCFSVPRERATWRMRRRKERNEVGLAILLSETFDN